MEKIAQKILSLALLMDRRSSVRMMVCIFPGIVISKIATQLGLGRITELVATLFLFFGMFVYFRWNWLREKVMAMDGDATAEAQNDEMTPAEMREELLLLCNGDEAMVNQAVMLELELDGSLTGVEAMAVALHRKVAANRLAATRGDETAPTRQSESSPQPTKAPRPETP